MVGETERAQEMEGLTVFEAKVVRTGKKRKREGKGDPGDVDGYKGPWREYIDQEKISKPSEEQRAVLELMYADKKTVKKQEDETIEESSLLHGALSPRIFNLLISLMSRPLIDANVIWVTSTMRWLWATSTEVVMDDLH